MPRKPLWGESSLNGPRTGHLGALLSEQPLLVQDANLVAYITNIRVYPFGLLFTALAEEAIADGPLKYSSDLPPSSSDEPNVTVTFSDGHTWRYGPEMRGDCLIPRASERAWGAEGASWRADYWLPALPTEGPVVFSISVGEYSGTASVDGGTVIAEPSTCGTNPRSDTGY
jgi:hypothetical protein